MSAPATAAAIREASDEDWAWRMLLQGRDHLRLLLRRHDGSEAAWEAAPSSTGRAGFDTLLAVLTAHEFKAPGEDPPEWSKVKGLSDPWVPEHTFLERDEIIEQTDPGLLGTGEHLRPCSRLGDCMSDTRNEFTAVEIVDLLSELDKRPKARGMLGSRAVVMGFVDRHMHADPLRTAGQVGLSSRSREAPAGCGCC